MSNLLSLREKCPIFAYFIYNQGKIFLILPITRGGTCVPSLHWEFPPTLELQFEYKI